MQDRYVAQARAAPASVMVKAVVPVPTSRLAARSRAGFQRVIHGCYLNKIAVARRADAASPRRCASRCTSTRPPRRTGCRFA